MTLAARILRVLGTSPLPVDTPSLVALCATGLSHARVRVLTELYELERGGLVVRGPVLELVIERRANPRQSRSGRYRVATWRLSS